MIPRGETAAETQARHAAIQEQCDASWTDLSASAVYAKLHALDGHPLRPILGRILAVAVARHAPQLVALIPPEFLEPAHAP